jgi:hypothetical protein
MPIRLLIIPYLSKYHAHLFTKFSAQNACVMFKDSIWVAQSATYTWRMYNTAVNLATLFLQAVSAVRQSKKTDLQNFPFLVTERSGMYC